MARPAEDFLWLAPSVEFPILHALCEEDEESWM
jgi:hypothetical protein